MNEPTPPISGQAAKLSTTRVNDVDQTTLVCVVHLNASPVYAECRAVARSGASREIGRSPAGWRFDSASAEYFEDTDTVRLWLSCWPDSQSGTQAAVRWVDFPGGMQPIAQVSAGGFVPMPAGYVRVFSEEAGFDGQRTIDLKAFSEIPHGIAGLAVRVCTIAEAADRTLRAAPNTDGAGASSICAWTQAADRRIYDSGTIGVGPNHTIVVWTPQGRIKQGWVDVMGVHY